MRAHPHFNPFNIHGEIEKPNWEDIFPNNNPLIVEIGFSNGKWLLAYAKEHPQENIVGLEVRKLFVDKVTSIIEKEKIKNAYVLLANANTALEQLFKPNSLAKVIILFPDPWYKKRHLKRRVINSDFIQILSKSMQKEAILHIATDKQDLSTEIREIVNNSQSFKNLYNKNTWAPENIPGFSSDIEYYHIKKNNPIYRLQYRRK